MKKSIILNSAFFILHSLFADSALPLLTGTDFISDNFGGVAGWSPISDQCEGSKRKIELVPHGAPNGLNAMRITGSHFLRMPAGSVKLVPGGKYRLAILARTKGLENQDRLQYLLYGYDGWSRDWVLNIPKDTNGDWKDLSREFTLPTSGSGNCTLCIYADKPFAEGASLELAHPRLEAVDELAKTGTDRFPEPVPLKARIVPVHPILSEVKATDAKLTFLFPGATSDAGENFVLRAKMDGAERTAAFGADHRATVDFGAIKPGKHEVALAVVGEKSGKTIVENSYPIWTLVTVENATPLKKLNNFVSEIYTKPLRNGSYEFVLEKASWVYIVLDRPYPSVFADVDGIKDALRYRYREPSETQRYLKAGKHVVTVSGVRGAAAKGTISVRLVKTIQMSGYKHIITPGGDYPKWGYSLDYYRAFNLFSTCNTIELDADRLASPRAIPVTHEFETRGIKMVAPGGPGAEDRCRDRLDTMIAAVQKNPAWAKNKPMAVDENAINASTLRKYNYSEAAWQLGLTNEEIHVWYADGFYSLFDRPFVDTMEVSAIVNSGAARATMFTEAYYRTPQDEAGQVELENWIRHQLETLRSCVPSAPSRYIYALSGWEFPGCFITKGSPDVDLKAFYARLMRMFATDPTFAEIGGVSFTTPICDEDLFRFIFPLFRHYCLEGKTDDYAANLGMSLFPNHLQNGDFDHGAANWAFESAATGSVTVADFGFFAKKCEKRILGPKTQHLGHKYAVMTVCANGPNRVCQSLKGLIPGNLYQITFVSVAGEDLDDPGSSKRTRTQLSCRVAGAEELDDLDHVIRMNGKGNAASKGKASVFVHRHVFRATAETAELLFSDWVGGKPLGAAGSRSAFHYVGCDSFFVRDNVDLENIRALNRENNFQFAER